LPCRIIEIEHDPFQAFCGGPDLKKTWFDIGNPGEISLAIVIAMVSPIV
jgi:hypothetical protein